ncbi:hypothetical protein KAH27_01595 [bacterium]|nr:hypothetical protein [bacterium]
MPENKKGKAWIVGIALDNDGHKRLTKGENFILAGGSEETHGRMTEGMIKLNESLQKRGKQLEEVSKEEFTDLAHKSGLITDPNRN